MLCSSPFSSTIGVPVLVVKRLEVGDRLGHHDGFAAGKFLQFAERHHAGLAADRQHRVRLVQAIATSLCADGAGSTGSSLGTPHFFRAPSIRASRSVIVSPPCNTAAHQSDHTVGPAAADHRRNRVADGIVPIAGLAAGLEQRHQLIIGAAGPGVGACARTGRLVGKADQVLDSIGRRVLSDVQRHQFGDVAALDAYSSSGS